MAMFKKNRNLGGIIQVGDNDEDIMDSVAGAEDSMGGEAVAPVKEDVWDTDEEKACGISGYMLGVNPFNQPGVEDYKRNMFALLEKPGYEAQTAEIKSRLK